MQRAFYDCYCEHSEIVVMVGRFAVVTCFVYDWFYVKHAVTY